MPRRRWQDKWMSPNMFRINLGNLLETLENLGETHAVTVPEAVKTEARIALDRMLTLTNS